VLCLLPFEPAAYAAVAVRAEFVGHPLAEQIPVESQRAAARDRLGIDSGARVVAVLPGSRNGEIRRLGNDFARATVALARQSPVPVEFIAPLVSAAQREMFAEQVRAAGAQVRLLHGQADDALAAADAALVASGTATLQAMLHGLPMVVAYRLAPLTAFIVRDLGLVKLRHFSLPNLLASEPLVPEFFQEAVQPQQLADALHAALTDPARREWLQGRFRSIHQGLRKGGAARAADVLLELLATRGIVAAGSGQS
jgi:lipid-A-disaccharide synthase